MSLYLDTSVLLKLCVEEAVGAADRVATSTSAYAEARAGLSRRFREEDFTREEYPSIVADLDEDWSTYDRLEASGELAGQHALRGYDSVHPASALRLAGREQSCAFSPSTSGSTMPLEALVLRFVVTVDPGVGQRSE